MRTTAAILTGAAALFFLLPAPARSQVYKWVDKQGRAHYTDDPDQLPEPQRTKVLNELEEKIKKERERREKLREQGIDVPDERLPPPPAPRPQEQRAHPATDRLNQRQAAKEKWSTMGKRARERVESLEEKCTELKAERDRNNQDRLTMSRPGAGQRYQKSQAAYQRCQENLRKARHYLEVELPEQARKSGIPPGWIR